jgi:hypothetical protein
MRRAEAMLLGQTGSPELFREAAREVESLAEFPEELADQGYPRRFVSAEFRGRLGLELAERAIAMAYASADRPKKGNKPWISCPPHLGAAKPKCRLPSSCGKRRHRHTGHLDRMGKPHVRTVDPPGGPGAVRYASADLLDSYVVDLPAHSTSDIRRLAELALSNPPASFRTLMAVRDAIMSRLGVKTSAEVRKANDGLPRSIFSRSSQHRTTKSSSVSTTSISTSGRGSHSFRRHRD